MKDFRGDTLSWNAEDGVIELVLDRAPCNEIGSATLVELEKFVAALETLQRRLPRTDYFQPARGGLLCRG